LCGRSKGVGDPAAKEAWVAVAGVVPVDIKDDVNGVEARVAVLVGHLMVDHLESGYSTADRGE
jgi:hypothetical protein